MLYGILDIAKVGGLRITVGRRKAINNATKIFQGEYI